MKKPDPPTPHDAGAEYVRPDIKYEASDARARPLILGFLSVIALIVGAFLAVGFLFVFLYERGEETGGRQPVGRGAVEYRPPEPRLQVSPGSELKQMLEKEQKLLESYGWVNKASGIVRIPVSRAMDIVAEQGLPNLPPIGMEEETPNPLANPEMLPQPAAAGVGQSGGPPGAGTSREAGQGAGQPGQNTPSQGNRRP